MSGKVTRVVACIGVTALALVAAALPSSAATRQGNAPQGVSDSQIDIVAIVPDLDELRARGFSFSPKLTTGNYLRRWQGYADAYGPVNGRKVVFKAIGWNPTDPTSQSTTCTKSTIDNKPFLVVNSAGYRQAYVPCIAVDNNTPMFSGDMSYEGMLEMTGKNLVTIGVAVEDAAKTAVQVVNKGKLVPKSAKIGIISNNDPQVKAAGDTLEAELEKRGYNVVETIELNGLAADATLISRESAAAVATLTTAGVDTVIMPQSTTPLAAFFDEAARSNAGFDKMVMFDGQAATCTPEQAPRTTVNAAGTICIAPWQSKAMPDKTGIRPDTPFEAECRKKFDAFTNSKSVPGAPNGDVEVNGVNYSEDFASVECNMTTLLLDAIKKAGKNVTWEKVRKNIFATTSAPAAYISDGEGGYSKKKPYFADKVQVSTFTIANKDTPKDANGVTFNGCPIPQNCWVPMEINGQQWFPVVTSAKG